MGIKISEATETLNSGNIKIPVAVDGHDEPYYVSGTMFADRDAWVTTTPSLAENRIYLRHLLDNPINTTTYTVLPEISLDTYYKIVDAFNWSRPLYIGTDGPYGGAIVANVSGYPLNLGKYQISFVLNRQAKAGRDAWNHAYCLNILPPEEGADTCVVEVVYDIDLQKVAKSIENEDVFVIEDEIPEEGLTLTDEQDEKIRKSKIVYYAYYSEYYSVNYCGQKDTGYMTFNVANLSSNLLTYTAITYWYKNSSYPKKLFLYQDSKYFISNPSSYVYLNDFVNIATGVINSGISTFVYEAVKYSYLNRVPLLLNTGITSAEGNITANVYKNDDVEAPIVTFIYNLRKDSTFEQHLVTIRVQETVNSDGEYPIELIEDINLSKSNSTPVYNIATVTESGTTVLDEDVSSITSADLIQLTNTGAIYRKMLDTASVIWFAYWNMVDDIVAQSIIQYDKATKELRLLPSNTLSSDIIELPDGALNSDTITDDNLQILQNNADKIIRYGRLLYYCGINSNSRIQLQLLNNSSTPSGHLAISQGTITVNLEDKTVYRNVATLYLYEGDGMLQLHSDGDGTKFLANDGDYKTINTTKEIPVVTLQVSDTMHASYASRGIQPLQFTISQEDAQKLINYPEHVYFVHNQSNTSMLLGTLFLKPNTVTQSGSSEVIVYITQDQRVSIDITELEHADVVIEYILSLPIGDNQHFYDSAGNERRLTNVILLSPNGNLNLNQFSTDSHIPTFLIRSMDTGETYNYTCDSVVMDGMDTIIVFKKIDYTIDQLNVVAIKISVNENNIVTGELISDKTYILTPKTE